MQRDRLVKFVISGPDLRPFSFVSFRIRTRGHADHQQSALRRMDRNLRHRTPDRRSPRQTDTPRKHSRDERRQLSPQPKPRSKGPIRHLITPNRIGPPGQCAMARASYLGSARAMALSAPPLAYFCAATWPVLSPPLTARLASKRSLPRRLARESLRPKRATQSA